MLGQGILAGKKTYVVALVGVIGFIASYLTGDTTLVDAAQGIFTAIMAATIRSGIKTEAAKLADAK